MELWFTEYQTPNVGITCKVEKSLLFEKTLFQEMSIIETDQFGRMLVLDGTVQTTEKDEFVYHEMITHVPLFTHPAPETALVIGGGDGGAIREILKHSSIKKAVLVEIDGTVVEVSKEFLPSISCALSDERASVVIADGIEYVKQHKNFFDVIMVDSTDPVGPAVGLFKAEFYSSIFDSLKEDGIFVAQTESPFFHKDLIKSVYNDVSSIFPITRVYTCAIPTYPSGFWSFTMGSKKHDPLLVNDERFKEYLLSFKTEYYTPDIHKAAFALPKFLERIIYGVK